MQTVLIVIHLFVVLAMVGFVLLQKSEGGGLGIGSTGGFLSSRGTSNVLSRTTAILAVTFFVTSMGLSILAGIDRKPTSVIKTGTGQQTPGAPAAPGGGLLDTLRGNRTGPIRAAGAGDRSRSQRGEPGNRPLRFWVPAGSRRIAPPALNDRPHGSLYFHYRRRGLLPWQGPGFRSAGRAAAGAWLPGAAAQA